MLVFLALVLHTCSAVPTRIAPERAAVEASSKVAEVATVQRDSPAITQWSNAANSGSMFSGYTPPLLTLIRYGRTANGVYRGSIAFLKIYSGQFKCGDHAFVDTEIGQVKNCDIKPGDVRNFQSDFFGWLGTVTPSTGAVTPVADNDPRWVSLGGGNWYVLPAGKTYVVRYGAGQGYMYQSFQGRFRCSNYWFGDPAIGVSKTCSYWSVPNDFLTPTGPPYMKTARGQFVDCATNGQTCVVQTDMRPYWARIYGFRNGEYTASYRMVDSDQWVCSSAAFGYDISSEQFSDAIGTGSFRCSWFKPDSFHFTPSGYWANVLSGPQGAALSYTLSYGVDTSMTTVDSKEYSHSVSTTVEAGFLFGSVSVSYGFAQTTAHSVENAASVSVGRECAVSTCNGAAGWITNVMWAWKMDIGEVCSWGDATCQATVNTCNFWCTSSISKPPKCPPGACKDLECQTCNAF